MKLPVRRHILKLSRAVLAATLALASVVLTGGCTDAEMENHDRAVGRAMDRITNDGTAADYDPNLQPVPDNWQKQPDF